MTKELVTIEFRFKDKPKGEYDSEYKSKTITIGVFDTFEEAIFEGNAALEALESQFKLHLFPNGNEATRDRFSKNGGCFGSSNRLVTNLAYLQTPFDFYAKIEQLKYDDIFLTIGETIAAGKRYKEYKLNKLE